MKSDAEKALGILRNRTGVAFSDKSKQSFEGRLNGNPAKLTLQQDKFRITLRVVEGRPADNEILVAYPLTGDAALRAHKVVENGRAITGVEDVNPQDVLTRISTAGFQPTLG